MSNWPQCDAALAASQASGDPWGYCTNVHCDEVSNYNHQFCDCTGQFARLKPPGGVCPNGIGSLIPNANPGCYCCCSCFAYDTPIAVSKDLYKVVQDFAINDPVWVAVDASLSAWVQKPVMFSSGTGADGRNRLIKIHFGDQTEGVKLESGSLQSQYITAEQSAGYYKILSTAPNDFIGNDGVVNLTMVKNANVDVISKLLSVPMVVAQQVFDTLSIDSNFLLVTSNQPFLMKDKTMKQAQKLVPGKDELVCEDGTTTPIISLEVGMFKKGVHHISTSNQPATSLDGHLLVANGIVVGDYSVQLSLASNQNNDLADVHESAPVFGTKEYNDQHSHLNATPFSARTATVTQKVAGFVVHQPSNSAVVPAGAYSFITSAQAKHLLNDGPIYPASKNVAEPDVMYLFRLFGAFYPDITFYYDHNNMLPNVYSFKQYGKQFVVVTTGWTLVEGVYLQGIAMAIAQVINQLLQEKMVPPGVNPVGKADYDIYPIFLSLFYRAPDAVKNYNLGIKQIKTVFDYIKRYRKTVGKIGLNCRMSTMEASINGLSLPHCAGGPPDPALELKSASAVTVEGQAVITLTFNMNVDPATGGRPANYMLDPNAAIFAAEVDADNPKKVYLTADLDSEQEYYVVAIGVLSTYLQPMVVGKNGAKFNY